MSESDTAQDPALAAVAAAPSHSDAILDLEAGHDPTLPPPPRALVLPTSAAVTFVLSAMILLPVAQTIARRLFHGDIPGASQYVQHCTLWTGCLGAVMASLLGRHLALSTVNLIPAGRWRHAAQSFANAATAGVCALLTYGSILLVWGDRTQDATLAGGVPTWWSEVILPVAFGAITLTSIWRAPGSTVRSRWAGRALALLAVLLVFAAGKLSHHQVEHLVWPGAILIIVAFLLGAPVFVAMAGLAMLLFWSGNPPTPIATVPTNTFQLVTNPTLPAVPLLTLAGYVLAAGGASKRLVAAYRALLGWLPSGLGLMALSVCALFTAFTGGSGVTILAMGGLIYPSLREENYPEGFSLGLVTAAGSLGLLFPPSLPVILYAVVAEADMKKLFLAGLVPGVLILALVALYTVVIGVKSGAPRHRFDAKEAAKAAWIAKWDLGLPILVIASIVTGFATIVESAGIAAFYSILVETVIFRNLKPTRDLPKVMASGAALVGSVIILMGIALGLTAYLVDAQIPDALLSWVQEHIKSQVTFLLVLNVLLLVLGSVLEMYSAIVVLAPLLVPLGVAYNIDPVHLGVVFLANLELGFLFPPMGLNLFLSATRFNKPLPSLYRHALPFLVIMTIGVLIVTYVPSFTTGVLHLLHVE